jgi:PAS domain S-box-containing protein
MTIRPLRNILILQTALVALLPFVVIAVGIAGWLLPSIREDAEMHQQQIAVAVASRVGSYLESSRLAVRSIGLLPLHENMDWHHLQHFIDAQVAASESLGVIYVAGPDGIVKVVGLLEQSEHQRQDLVGLDLQLNPLFTQVKAKNTIVWSDSFLSAVEGGLSVALAFSANEKIVFGEVRLDRLAKFLGQVGDFGDEQIFVLDRRGNVVADSSGRHTGQQLNVSNLPLVQAGMAGSDAQVGELRLNGVDMVGSYLPIPDVGWSVLVAQPLQLAYRSLWGTLGVIACSLVLALALGIFLSVRMARKLATRFELLAAHARRVADGHEAAGWPQSSILEFQELTADLQRMAETIRHREREQVTLMRNIPGMVYRCANAPHWPMTFVSDGCLQLTGYTADALLQGEGFAALIHQEDRLRVWREVQEALLQRRPFMLQYRIVTADGTEKWVAEHGQAVLSDDGGLQSLEGIITDISDRVRLEEQLHQAQKMESVGQLAGGIAHDFNNMLTAIIGSTEIIRMELDEKHPLLGVVEIIRKAANKSADLIRKLLVFSRKAPRELHAVDLLERSIDKRIDVSCLFSDKPVIISGDAGHLENAFLNLGLNARDAMPNGGTLRIATQLITIDAEIAREMGQALPPGHYVEVVFTDTGAGMSRELQERIFEPFFTTKEVGKGTGLGLAAVYGTIRDHGGTIRVESEPGMGSTFRIYLPVSQANGIASRPAGRHVVPAGRTVLFVDDEEFLRQVGGAMLSEMGLNVILAGDGREALDLFAVRWQEIDIVMLDMVMPNINGRDVFMVMKDLNPAVRVLFMSGYALDTSVEDLMTDPAVAGFLQKPYRAEDIRQALASALGSGNPAS